MSGINSISFEFRGYHAIVDNTLEDLPLDTLNEIFRKLNGLQLVVCGRVCKKLHAQVQKINSYQKKITIAKFAVQLFNESLENVTTSLMTGAIAKILADNHRLQDLRALINPKDIRYKDIPDKEYLLLLAIPLVAMSNIKEALDMLDQVNKTIASAKNYFIASSLFAAKLAIAKALVDKGQVNAAIKRSDGIPPKEKSKFQEQLAFYLVKKGYIKEAQEFVNSSAVLGAIGNYLVENKRLDEAVAIVYQDSQAIESLVKKILNRGEFDLARQVDKKILDMADQKRCRFISSEKMIEFQFLENMIPIDLEQALEVIFDSKHVPVKLLPILYKELVIKGRPDRAKEVAKKLKELKVDYNTYEEGVGWAASIFEHILKGDFDKAQEIISEKKHPVWLQDVRKFLCYAFIDKGGDHLLVALNLAREIGKHDLLMKIAKAYALQGNFELSRNVFSELSPERLVLALMELSIELTE